MATSPSPPRNPTSFSSSPPMLPPPPPQPLQSISPPRPKPLPSPWSHQETLHLITAYQHKWYSLHRGQLKASQWEEVSAEVSARCGFPSPSKTATQCRHKIEKLRKRYRAEKTKPNPRAWQYFDLMHALDHCPVPARPIAMIANGRGIEVDEEEAVNLVNFAKSGRRDRAMRDREMRGCGGGYGKMESSESEEEREEGDVAVAREIRAFADRLVGVEKRRMEMMRETQMYRTEVENRRTEMVLESQRKIVDTIRRAFRSHSKKMKMDVEDS